MEGKNGEKGREGGKYKRAGVRGEEGCLTGVMHYTNKPLESLSVTQVLMAVMTKNLQDNPRYSDPVMNGDGWRGRRARTRTRRNRGRAA